MATAIPTVEGFREPDAEDIAYMEYLDDLAPDLPGGHSFAQLVFKADPIAFRMGKAEWLAERQRETE